VDGGDAAGQLPDLDHLVPGGVEREVGHPGIEARADADGGQIAHVDVGAPHRALRPDDDLGPPGELAHEVGEGEAGGLGRPWARDVEHASDDRSRPGVGRGAAQRELVDPLEDAVGVRRDV
jgi:hypothetical protein